jgi:hypothetical protein
LFEQKKAERFDVDDGKTMLLISAVVSMRVGLSGLVGRVDWSTDCILQLNENKKG